MKLSSLSLVKYALAVVLTLLFGTAYSQYPATGNKQRLGWQTTGDGLVYRGAIADTSTLDPSGLNNAWMLLDTVNGSLYAYRSKAWQLVSGGGGGGVSMPFDSVTFNINESDASEQELKYSAEKGYLQYGGLDSVQIPLLPGIWYVRNDDSVTVSKGMVVRASGTLGASGRIKVKRMIADGTIPAMYVLGIAMHDIATGADGYVMTQGKIRQVNTTAYSEGAVLYADVDTLGGLTQTEPGNGYLKLPIAFVVHSASNGTLAVRIDAGSSLRDLHDVDTTGKVDGSVLRYDSTAGYWKASTTAGIVAGDTAAMLTNYINVADTATMLSSYISNADTSVFARDWQIAGTANYLPRFTGSGGSIGNSNSYQTGDTLLTLMSPFYGLRLNGNSTPNSFTGWMPYSKMVLNVNGTSFAGIAMGDPTNSPVSNQVAIQMTSWTGGGANFYSTRLTNDNAGNFRIATSPVSQDADTVLNTRFSIMNDGKVGIGTTTPLELLDVNGVGRFRQSGGAGGGPIEISDRKSTFNQNINWNVYYDGSSWKYRNSDFGASIGLNNSGDLIFANIASGTAGNNVTAFRERLKINENGNIGIATASPARSLHITAVDAIKIPAGTTAQRPSIGIPGDLRFNNTTDSTVLEFYDGTGWRKPIVTNRGNGKGVANSFLKFDAAGFADTSAVLTQSNGRIGIGVASPTQALDVASDILVNGMRLGRGPFNLSTNLALGVNALNAVNASAGSNNVAIGSNTLLSNTNTANNIAIGESALRNYNVSVVDAFGRGNNTAIGGSAMFSLVKDTLNISVANNTAIGLSAMLYTKYSDQNTAIGVNAMRHSEGVGNLALGNAALFGRDPYPSPTPAWGVRYRRSVDYNVAIGIGALQNFGRVAVLNTVISNNVAIGRNAANTVSDTNLNRSVINSVYIGALSAVSSGTSDISNEIVIGYNIAGRGSNTTTIGNTSTTATYIPAGKLRIGNTTAPTATLHLPAGTASANTAPLKFTSGTNLTTAEAGAVEWNGNHLYVTNGSAQRRTVNQSIRDSCLCEFTSVPANGHADIKVKVTGSVPGDVVTLGVRNAAMAADIHFFAWVHDTDSVTIRCLNNNSTTARTSNQAMMSIIVTKFNLMKHLIVLLLMFLQPFFAKAQELVKDSVWLTREAYETTDTNGRTTGLNWTFIRNTYFEFDDLSGRLEKLPIGDTVQARSALLGWQVDMVRQHSYHAVQAMKKGQVVADWQQVNAAMKANGLGGLDEAMQAAFEGQLIGDAFVKIGTAAFVPADVVKNAAGNLRLLFGNSGYRLLPYADTMLRIVGYPATGQNTDLYKVKEKVYRDMNNTFTLRLK